MENNNGGSSVLMTVIGVATLLVALVGASFAYFSVRITNNNAQSISVTTATPIALVYAGGSTLELSNALPGDSTASNSANGRFTIANSDQASVSQTYDLEFVVDSSTFTNVHTQVTGDSNDNVATGTLQNNQLVLNLVSAASDTNTNTPANYVASTHAYGILLNSIDLTSKAANSRTKFIEDQPIAPGETHTYQLQLVFANLETNQDENQGSSFSGHVEISDPKTVSAN